jgi:trk system potassium uptake protein TrkH
VSFLRPILLVQAFVLFLMAALMIPPLVLSALDHSDTWPAFGAAALAYLAIAGLLLPLTHKRGEPVEFNTRQLFTLTTMSWAVASLAGAVPLYLGLPELSFTDALFEAVSGITTTGSTVLIGLQYMPHGVLLWRGLLQWIGGIGIVVLGIAILPFLQIGGMRLFQTESSDWSEKVLPRSGHFIRAISIVYLALTLSAALAYLLGGMRPFDAVVHAMTTVATGGYANHDASMGQYASQPAILWSGSLFMLLAGLPFLLYARALKGEVMPLIRDRQVRGFLGLIALMVISLTLVRSIADHESWFEALAHSTFNVVSVITTTGFASEDYTAWDSFAVTVFFYLTFVGGCSGSTAGGVKIFRFQIGILMLLNQLRWMRHPRIVISNRYNDREVTDDVVRSVVAFSFYFFLTVATIALGLSLLGVDFLTSLSGAATAVANVGPGLGNIIGPAGNFAPLPDPAKWLLCAGMLLGRLEIMTVLILLMPTFWRR